MRQRDAGHTLRFSPFVRKATPRLPGTADGGCRPLTRVSLLCLFCTIIQLFQEIASPGRASKKNQRKCCVCNTLLSDFAV